jgi:hypothetical protein
MWSSMSGIEITKWRLAFIQHMEYEVNKRMIRDKDKNNAASGGIRSAEMIVHSK